MKYFLTFILMLLMQVNVWADSRMVQANELYAQSKYEEAAKLYEQLVNENKESVALYFNLGNAYYRQGESTKAVLNYERALLLAPDDEAVQANLAIAHLVVGDKMEAVPEFFLLEWFRAFYRVLSADAWGIISMIFFAACIAAISLYLFSTNLSLRKMGFYLAGFALFFSVSTLFLASRHHSYVNNHKHAIIYADRLTVVSAPNEEANELFVVHEGTKVEIIHKQNSWREIKLADGRVGWVKASEMVTI